MDLLAYSDRVEAVVLEHYGHTDGGDLCYNLAQAGVIDPNVDTINAAAAIVAQHMEQP